MSQNELYHHGIDGQKWGIRHGPPYPLDRADHNKVVEKSEKASKKRHLSYRGSRKYAKRMSDKDLNDTIDRLQREETYRRLVSKEKSDKKAAKAAKKEAKEAKVRYENQNEMQKQQLELQKQQFEEQKKANSIVRKVITNLLTNAATVAGKEITKRVINEKLGVDNTKEKEKNKTENTKSKEEKTSSKSEELFKEADKMKAKREELENYAKELENRTKEVSKDTPVYNKPQPHVSLETPNLPSYKQMYDLPAPISDLSESQINSILIDMHDGMYMSDESEGACV